MTSNRELFTNFSAIDEGVQVQVGDGEFLNIKGKGDISLQLKLPTGRTVRCQLKDVFYVPKLAHNLISVSHVTRSGNFLKFCENSCKIIHDNRIIAYGSKLNNLYVLDHVENPSTRYPYMSFIFI